MPMVRFWALKAVDRLDLADLAVDATISRVLDPSEIPMVISTAIFLLREITDQKNREAAVDALNRFLGKAGNGLPRLIAITTIKDLKSER